ncbi:MAG: phasin family protein, partial [bacterium]|nr:phasin family protein [bacterium]
MAVTPKAGRGKAPVKSPSATLSASEAFKAAEAAIGTAPPVAKTPAPRKVVAAKVKAIDSNPSAASVKALDANPSAIAAATTAVDAAPEPAPEPVLMAPDPVETPTEPLITQSLPQEAGSIETKPLLEGTKTMNDMMETGKKFAEDTKVKLETVYAD